MTRNVPISTSVVNSYLNPTTINLNVPDQVLLVQLSSVPEPGVILIAVGGLLLLRQTKIHAR